MRLIDADLLYERACSLEARALDYVGKLIERDGDEVSVEWKIWSAILAERTAFKHDVFDAPTIEPQRWIPCSELLPEALQEVIVTSTAGYVYTSRIVHGDFEYGGNVIAWMPLPTPYREEGGKQ